MMVEYRTKDSLNSISKDKGLLVAMMYFKRSINFLITMREPLLHLEVDTLMKKSSNLAQFMDQSFGEVILERLFKTFVRIITLQQVVR
jgi:hypothetical protein